uniref:Uncharacterized protein n=1 Tax=Anguilla anguilla TaxID=7936 RepID=A0A0E9UWI7_ANGAN
MHCKILTIQYTLHNDNWQINYSCYTFM